MNKKKAKGGKAKRRELKAREKANNLKNTDIEEKKVKEIIASFTF